MDIIPGPNFLKFSELNVTIDGENNALPCSSFHLLDLKPAILDALSRKNFGRPTPIQSHVIPAIQDGRDVLAASPTGSGKTVNKLPLLIFFWVTEYSP